MNNEKYVQLREQQGYTPNQIAKELVEMRKKLISSHIEQIFEDASNLGTFGKVGPGPKFDEDSFGYRTIAMKQLEENR